jgi:hypothetical protein
MNASSDPVSTAVTREPMAWLTPVGGPPRLASSLSSSGNSSTRKPSAFARIQPGRSITATTALPVGACIPVTART